MWSAGCILKALTYSHDIKGYKLLLHESDFIQDLTTINIATFMQFTATVPLFVLVHQKACLSNLHPMPGIVQENFYLSQLSSYKQTLNPHVPEQSFL